MADNQNKSGDNAWSCKEGLPYSLGMIMSGYPDITIHLGKDKDNGQKI